ncbi:MAG: ABC transporter permease [Planctomycetota bacterium]
MRSLRIILVLAGKQLRILSRMPAILLVIFLPGIVMYSVFTKIFEGPAGVRRPFRAAVVDLDHSEESRRLIDALAESNVTVIRTEDEEPNGPLLTVESARRQIRKEGKYRVALVIPEGFGGAPDMLAGERHKGVQLIHDETQPMEADAILGMLQMAAGRRLFEKAFKLFDRDSPTGGEAATQPSVLVKVEKVGVAIDRAQISSKHTFLAGVVPLFLLFACVGAARGLLDELSSGGIRRMLVAPVSPAHVLVGQQLYAFVLAFAQCTVMYVYAWLVFDVDIWTISGGLLALTVATCLATTGFGMLMASVCKTGEHLDAIGTTTILAMSAIGGSMVPRFIMPAWMQPLGLFTINGWSYDGFISLVRNEGFGLATLLNDGEISGIWMPCLVLTLVAAGCATIGSIFLARRLRAGPSA